MDKQAQTKIISEAYINMVTEAKESKFKVGDKVGIGDFGGYTSYHPHDTGTVTKVHGNGRTTVTHDTRKNRDDPGKPYESIFDHMGYSTNPHSNAKIIPHAEHESLVRSNKLDRERASDMHHIIEHISGKKNGFGQFSKLSKTHADHLKSLIDKHTEE